MKVGCVGWGPHQRGEQGLRSLSLLNHFQKSLMIVFLMYFAHEVLKVNQKDNRRRYPHNSDFYLPAALCSKRGDPILPSSAWSLCGRFFALFFFFKTEHAGVNYMKGNLPFLESMDSMALTQAFEICLRSSVF